MYIIMTYDVGVERVVKVLKTGRKYLTHVQNSVLEGEISPRRFRDLKRELNKIIDKNHDAISFYKLISENTLKKERLGVATNEPVEVL